MTQHYAIKWKPKADNLYACFEHPDQALEAAIVMNQVVADSGMMIGDNELHGDTNSTVFFRLSS